MFSSTLKLFSQVPCPDDQCLRSPCLFSHNIQHKTIAPAPPIANPSVPSRAPAKTSNLFIPGNIAKSNGARPQATSRTPKPVGATTANAVTTITGFDMARGLAAQSARPGSAATSRTVSTPSSTGEVSDHSRASRLPLQTKTMPSGMIKRPNMVAKPSVSSMAVTGTLGETTTSHYAPKPPVLIASGKLSKQPIIERQRALRRLFDEYSRLYAKILHLAPDLPAATAKRQEADTSSVTNKHSYSQAIHSVLIELRQRPLPETLDSPYVGTISESREKCKIEEERRNSALTVERIARYVIPVSRLESLGFITSVPREPGGTQPEALSETKTCDRCHEKFVVSDRVDYDAFTRQAGRGECVYHWGKCQPARQEGSKVWLWTCCNESRHAEGCVDGLHVFRDGYPFGHELQEGEPSEALLLHRRKAFKTTRQVTEERRARDSLWKPSRKRKMDETYDIVALDCEMISTTAGIALGRLSVVNAQGENLLDICVKQSATILDLNTRFSGLTLEEFRGAVHDLDAARDELCSIIDEDTIIIGHGLDNDLKALRLIHTRIIDTAIMYPHEKGFPYKRALKDVLSEKVGTFIQNNIMEDGHDSSADAKAALDLVKWRVKMDVASGLAE